MKRLRSLINQFNDFIADRMSYVLSMMATFYVISLLVAVPLLYSQPTSIVAWASYLCSVVFQGLALPVLGYTARKSGDKTDEMMRDMLKMTKHIEKLTGLIEKQQEHLSKDIDDIIDDLETKKEDN